MEPWERAGNTDSWRVMQPSFGWHITGAGVLRVRAPDVWLCKPHKHQAERHRGRARSNRSWHEQQVAADHGYRDRSDPAK